MQIGPCRNSTEEMERTISGSRGKAFAPECNLSYIYQPTVTIKVVWGNTLPKSAFGIHAVGARTIGACLDQSLSNTMHDLGQVAIAPDSMFSR
jgi:hypothetical protein